MTPPLGQGAQVGPYEVVGHIATGGMGEVYLARKRGIGGFERTVVLKVMLPHLAQDERFARMFVDEARIASGLSHPNIVQVYDLGSSEEGGLYLAMEHLQGVSAIACLKKCAQDALWIPQEVAARAICDAATGLAYAHAATGEDGSILGLVHRDISPENLFMTYAGPTKVLDFGVAKVRDKLAKTQAGEFKGKVGYMAPEIIRGEDPDARADLFSLGVVFFELLTNRRLFHAAVPATALHRVLSAPVPDVRSLREDVDNLLSEMVGKLLDRNPKKRIASAEETADRLETWLEGRPGTPKHLSRWLQDKFSDAHALSARIAKAVEHTGQIDPDHLKEARRLNGDALADTLVRELSDSERHPLVPSTTGFDGAEADDSWIRRDNRSRWLWAFMVVVALSGLAWWIAERRLQPPQGRVWAGQYMQKEALHESTAGAVLMAEGRSDQQPRVVVAETATANTGLALGALEEARRRLERLEDPGLPTPVDVGVHESQPFSVYTLEGGQTLADMLDTEVVNGKRGLRLVRSIAEVMAIAEEGKLVHGWLSPELVWVTATDQIRILGFRGPRPIPSADAQRAAGVRLAPELTSGTPAGPSADQYALASMLAAVLRQVDQSSAVRAAAVLARATAFEPRARYATTEAFVAELERALRPKRRRRRR